jgi:Cu(I)/Ag(I) efflux system membrane fusion protein
MPGDFGKMPKYASSRKQKLLFYGLSNAQIESIKGKKQFHHTLLYLQRIYFGIAATEGSYVMEGAAIIKLAALNSLA